MSTIAIEPEAIQDALPVCFCHWRENPYRLVSLWDLMLRKLHAYSFVACTCSLVKYWQGLAKGGQFTDAGIKELVSALGELQRECEHNGFTSSLKQVLRIKEYFKTNASGIANATLSQLLGEVVVRVQEDLEKETFLHVPYAGVLLYEPAEPLFGPLVESNFLSCSYDIVEAGKCCALHRSTACVFHLMRVLEVGLSVLAVRFGVPSDHANWQKIIEGIEKAIRGMASDPNRSTDWKDQQEYYSQAASHFMVFKDAWRNHTMHARTNSKYTEEEARRILDNVLGFMQKLATRLHE
jgi:hypothetical protein